MKVDCVFLSACLSTYLLTCLPACLPVYLPTYLLACLPTCLPACLPDNTEPLYQQHLPEVPDSDNNSEVF